MHKFTALDKPNIEITKVPRRIKPKEARRERYHATLQANTKLICLQFQIFILQFISRRFGKRVRFAILNFAF